MNETRTFSPAVVLSVGIAAIVLLAVGFAAWLNSPEASLSGLTFRQGVVSEPADLGGAAINAAGMAIYLRSERGSAFAHPNRAGLSRYWESERKGGVTAPDAKADGLQIYRESERGGTTSPRPNEAGLAIYLQSEREAFPATVDLAAEAGLAIYLASEHGLTSEGQTDEGMAIYHASEWGR